MTLFSVVLAVLGSIPSVPTEPYGRILNLEFEHLEMSVTEWYTIESRQDSGCTAKAPESLLFQLQSFDSV